MRQRGHRRVGGYTLVEFIVAMTLVGIVMVLLTGGLFLGVRSWEAVDGKTTRVGDGRQALEFLRLQLSQARPVVHQSPDGEAPLFWGSRNMLEWVAPLPPYVGPGGLSVLRLSMDANAAPGELVLERWFLHPQPEGEGLSSGQAWVPMTARAEPPPQDGGALYGRHVLLERLDDLDIAYFGVVEAGREPQWVDRWYGSASLPRLLRVRLSQSGEYWPDLVVELPAPALQPRRPQAGYRSVTGPAKG